jgi:hypothetical protein
MKLKFSAVALFLSVSGPAYADQTMTNLAAAANQIEAQLNLATSLSNSLHGYGHSTSIVETGVTDPALIDQQMLAAYNSAIDAVLNTQYVTAQYVFMEQHNAAIDGLHTAMNDLVEATAVLATVSAVADMAESADTTQEQIQVQAALATTDMTITQAEVDNFNSALGAVENYAQQAGAFLAAASNTNVTAAVDNFAAANNVAVASYTAISYTQSMDQFVIEFGTMAYMEFNGAFASSMKSADDIWGNVGYGG